ncbi:Oidioi.mRNA.OKI2018_I69.YSR.g17061.t1.cds [Oikopleura dioica]|uniref:Oidioi.mRNA.OKI2018_I69.YSR.g17061.t1.cds n=1 Tax=Oikopleura dioica TaxID=34765 RepID=A0ABN7SLU1_OIKDI|nr:Oidioi.mRNA.OKI2018_I69.YSR.g17061.t1.cds [Oikopleura dioica]
MKRKVNDALNVLMGLKIVYKERNKEKTISWVDLQNQVLLKSLLLTAVCLKKKNNFSSIKITFFFHLFLELGDFGETHKHVLLGGHRLDEVTEKVFKLISSFLWNICQEDQMLTRLFENIRNVYLMNRGDLFNCFSDFLAEHLTDVIYVTPVGYAFFSIFGQLCTPDRKKVKRGLGKYDFIVFRCIRIVFDEANNMVILEWKSTPTAMVIRVDTEAKVIAKVEMSRCAILKSAVKPKMSADAAIEIADALKAAKDGRFPSGFFGEATVNLDQEEQESLDAKKKSVGTKKEKNENDRGQKNQ